MENNRCWWRSTKAYDEYRIITDNTNNDQPNSIGKTPRFRVMVELERLDLMSQSSFYRLRERLHRYKAGDYWVQAGGIKKKDLDIPSINTILLVGFSGSGKTSLVNLMYSVLCGTTANTAALIPRGGRSNDQMYMEEHNVLRSDQRGFCVYDSRGFGYDDVEEAIAELSNWMHNGVRHNQSGLKSSDDCNGKFIKRRVNYAMFVVDIAQVYKAFKAGDAKPLEETKKLFCSVSIKNCNKKPVLILTHSDLLTAEERLEGRLKLCECLGVSESRGVYDIVCLNYGISDEDLDRIAAYALLESLFNALSISDRSHCLKRSLCDCISSVFFSIMREYIEVCSRNKRE